MFFLCNFFSEGLRDLDLGSIVDSNVPGEFYSLVYSVIAAVRRPQRSSHVIPSFEPSCLLSHMSPPELLRLV